MSYEFTMNAVKSTVTQMGGVLKSVSATVKNIVTGWISGGGPFAKIWSGIETAFDSVIAKFKTAVEEKPLAVLAIAAVVVIVGGLAVVYLGPGVIGKTISGAFKAVGDAVAGVFQAIKRAIGGIFRR